MMTDAMQEIFIAKLLDGLTLAQWCRQVTNASFPNDVRAALEAVLPLLAKSEPGAVGMVVRGPIQQAIADLDEVFAPGLDLDSGMVESNWVTVRNFALQALAAAPAQAAPASDGKAEAQQEAK